MYPEIEPYETGFLDVGDGHRLYYELSGNPQGRPAVYLHGGPGGGIHPDLRRFFNPAHYKIVLFDQRGAGKSKPFAATESNTIQHLVGDMEKIRRHLGIGQWLVVGGSWGSTLALFYVLDHADAVSGLIVSGISFADKRGANWLTEEGGASEIMPEWFAPYRDHIPPEKRGGGLAEAYHQIMQTGTPEEVLEATRLFTVWDTAILHFDFPADRIREVESDPGRFIPLTKIFLHFVHHYYRDENRTRILEGVRGLGHVSCFIVHGRFDLICPARQAYELHRAFPGSELFMLHATGHTTREPNIAGKIVELTDRLAEGA